MNVEIEFENYNIKSPKMPDPFNVNLINAVGSGGGGGGNEVELTWAEYEALSEAEKMNGTNYFITDINTTKSLTSKVLCDITNISRTTYNLADDITNYDFLIAEIINNGSSAMCRSERTIYPHGSKNFLASFFIRNDYNASIECSFNSNTTLTIDDYNSSSSSAINTCAFRLTGYIYQRVVVPNQMINYSTIETKIGTWIDGKPIYKITIPVTHNYTLPNSAWLHIMELDTLAQDIGVIIDVKAISYEGTYNNIANYTTRIVEASPNESLPREISFQSMRNGNDYINSGGFIILQYTKHTD